MEAENTESNPTVPLQLQYNIFKKHCFQVLNTATPPNQVWLHVCWMLTVLGCLGIIWRLLHANNFLAALSFRQWLILLIPFVLTWICLNWTGGWILHVSPILVLPLLLVTNFGTQTIISGYIDATAMKALKEMDFQRVGWMQKW